MTLFLDFAFGRRARRGGQLGEGALLWTSGTGFVYAFVR